MDEFILPDSLDGLSTGELQGLHEQAVAEFNRLNESDNVDDATIERMTFLVESAETIRNKMNEAQAAAARRSELASRMQSFQTNPNPGNAEPAPADGNNTGETTTGDNNTGETTTGDNNTGETTSTGGNTGGTGNVTAAARPRSETQVPESRRPQLVITAAADIPSIPSGAQLDVNDLARAMHLKARTLQDRSGLVPIATIDKEFPAEYDLTDLSRKDIAERIIELSSPSALTASGGWCAPSERIYGFFDLECARGSVLQLPSFRANRGGVEWPVSEGLPAANTVDWVHTEEDDIAGYTKPCITIPCPTWTEVRLGAHGVCVTAGNLMDRAFPEQIRRYINQVFIAHERDENLRKIAILSAGSTLVTHPETFGAASSVVSAVLLSAASYRDRYRMCDGAMLEAVFPLWVREVIRADLARREGAFQGANGLPTNGEINGWFRDAGVTPQFVNDWQALGTNVTAFPTTVDFLMYAPGSWTLFDGGTLDLGITRDSVLNSTNDFTAAWTEDFWAIGYRGYAGGSLRVRASVCPSGAVGAPVTFDCTP